MSIQPNELRIGNLINNGFKTVTVRGVDAEGILLLMKPISMVSTMFPARFDIEYERLYLAYELAEPIPLTPEWLERLSIESCREDTVFHLKNGMPSYWATPSNSGWVVNSGYIAGLRVNYVHQLQNLYFALTGEELTVKEMA